MNDRLLEIAVEFIQDGAGGAQSAVSLVKRQKRLKPQRWQWATAFSASPLASEPRSPASRPRLSKRPVS